MKARLGPTYQLLGHPFRALGQELEVRVGVDVQDVDQLGLQQGANVHPFLVHLLYSGNKEIPVLYGFDSSTI